ncbi:hypothetical protein [Verrucomicrobium sp. BvORR106]|uniref:hypothetical protein n=1 Tax=Verrucomicrobium sp. BvORR106 TaxID=1403819 RepID=UPI00057193A6|nr:hypothetical protein [Verrucomicrobium sp. BvORR106]
MHPRYQEWIRYVFDHPVTQPEWHLDCNAPSFEANETEEVQLIELTFRNAARDLAPFSNAQINQGFWFLASLAYSEHLNALRSNEVPLELRLSAIDSISSLYRGCFASRCSHTLIVSDDKPSSDLNPICYMFWDVATLSNLVGNPDEEALANACFSVLAETLQIDHPACQEAAIHGYGEFYFQYPERVAAAMDEFLQTEIADPRLRAYATHARTGDIM